MDTRCQAQAPSTVPHLISSQIKLTVIKQVLHSHCHQLRASLAHLGFGQHHKFGTIKRDDVLCCSLLQCLSHLCGKKMTQESDTYSTSFPWIPLLPTPFPAPAQVITFSFTPQVCNYNRHETNGKHQTTHTSDAKEDRRVI